MPEPGSAEFNQSVDRRNDLVVSDLGVTEVVSALARRVRQAEVTPEAARRVQHALVVGLDDGVYQRVELTPGVHHRQAEHFLSSLTETPLRAADALHLALATSARAASLASFDRRLSAAARAVGLATYPARVGSPP